MIMICFYNQATVQVLVFIHVFIYKSKYLRSYEKCLWSTYLKYLCS